MKRANYTLVIAIFLLVVASVGSTPKLLWHGLLAHHAHNHLNHEGAATVASDAGFHCTLDQHGVTTEFILPAGITVQPVIASGASPDAPVFYFACCCANKRLTLRGPPMA